MSDNQGRINRQSFDDIDEKKMHHMWRKIYLAERNNLKTANLKDKDMRKKIEEIIEGEADKCF